MQSTHAGGSRGWLPPALLAVVALVATAVLWFQVTAAEAPPAPSAVGSPGSPSVSAPATVPSRPGPGRATATKVPQKVTALPGAGAPQRVVVESLRIDAPVVPIATQGTSLDPPDDPQVLGWWSGGAPTGAARGSALVTGHTVNAGGGAMDDLEEVRSGAEIEVVTEAGSIRYVAKSVQVLGKDEIARQAQDLFSQQVPGRLVLVTCEDWDGTGYRSNVVVTAVPVR